MEHHWNNPSGHVGTRTCVSGLKSIYWIGRIEKDSVA